jgi:hypothetical protein
VEPIALTRCSTGVVRAGVLAAAVVAVAALVPGVSASSSRAAPLREFRCGAATTKTLIHEFIRDYAAGRVAIIDPLWAPAPRFQWFSTAPPGARLGKKAYHRATLAGYFRSRVRVHERIRITQLGAGYDAKRDIVNFGGKLVRSADDIRSRAPHDFKGAADCVSGRPLFIVWSM